MEKQLATLKTELAELKKQNKTLLESDKNFNNVFYNAVDAVFIISGATFVDCNMSAVQMLSATDKASVLSTHPSELSPEYQPDGRSSREKADEMIAIALNTGFHRFEWMHKKVSGKDLPVEVSLTVITLEGEKVIHCLWKDLTEQKQAEHVLRQAIKKSEESNRIKSDFLATMSHEIRTPMTAILGVSELLSNTELNDEQQTFVSIIQRSGDNLLTIINDILDYSKIEAQKMELDAVTFNLPQLLEACVAPYKMMAESSVSLVTTIDPNASLLLRGDANRLTQVISNLLSNAFKFTSKGIVKLDIHVTQRTDNQATINFCITDSGVGIPTEQQKYLFQPFTQADQSTSRKYGGTGLGLAICKRLIEAMGGKITLSSKAGKGSSFQFALTFPIAGQADVEYTAAEDDTDFSQLHILLVEDNLVNRTVISKMMETLKVNIQLAADGKTAVDIICKQQHHFDLILMDCEMPGMDGYTATRKIREWECVNQQPATPICALTAHAMPEHIKKCHDSGMNDHLSKPVKLTDLRSIISKARRQYNFL